jgi:hypothetical protein
MHIELRKIKYFAAGSEETSCFVANVYIDGKESGEVKNEGHGGCNFYYPFELETRINEYAKTLPPRKFSLEGVPEDETYQPDADTLISDLLEEYLSTKELKRLLASKAVYTVNDKAGIFATPKLTPVQMAQMRQKGIGCLPTKWNVKHLLNVLPFEEALTIYRKG